MVIFCFCASDVAKALGYDKPNNAISMHCRSTLKRGIPHPQSLDKTMEVLFIPESDLYRLVLRSRLPDAEKFTDWVTGEVLPSIRKHEMYITPQKTEEILNNPDVLISALTALKEEREKRKALEEENQRLVPKANYCDLVLKAENAISVTQIAKDYGMSAISFNKLLCDLKIQYKSGSCWVLYQKYADKGYTKTSTYSVDKEKSVIHTYWTQKGRLFLYDVLKRNNVIPAMEMPALCTL